MSRSAFLVASFVAGCGRLEFTHLGDAHTDAVSDVVSSDAPICHTGTWSAPQLVPGLATGSEENSPWVSADERTIYFSSNRVGGQARAIWMATRPTKTDSFGTPTLVANIDSPMDEGDPQLTADELTLYFYTRRTGTDEVWIATRPTTADTFTVQGAMVITGSTTPSSGPSLSVDEQTFYYTHDQLQIAFATRPDRASGFTFVRELAEVNAPATDLDPSISTDGLELFFGSYRTSPGATYVATRGSTADMFSSPTELTSIQAMVGGYTGTPEISADGRTLYYGADSPGPQVDLYYATRSCD